MLAGAAIGLQAAVIALAGPIVVPFYSTGRLVSLSVWKIGYFKDEIGWPEMTAQVQRAWTALPANERNGGAIIAAKDREASALAFYRHALPTILSGHLSWQYWHPSRLPQHFVLTVGYQPQRLAVLCTSATPIARIDNRWHSTTRNAGS